MIRETAVTRAMDEVARASVEKVLLERGNLVAAAAADRAHRLISSPNDLSATSIHNCLVPTHRS